MTEPASLGAALGSLAGTLREAGIEEARLDARLLLANALEIDPGEIPLHAERSLDAHEHSRIRALARRRLDREPVARILGVREFWSLPFRLGPNTLVPRPESETLIEAALAHGIEGAARVLDLGTGSGCLLLALLSELPDARGVGTDISEGALRTARENARDLGMEDRAAFLASDWGTALAGGFDLIVVNPPYIPDGELARLAPEVARFDPAAALQGGADGLDSYRRLVPGLVDLLAPGGAAFLEVGPGQAAPVAAMVRANGLREGPVRRDLGGRERCVSATLAGQSPAPPLLPRKREKRSQGVNIKDRWYKLFPKQGKPARS